MRREIYEMLCERLKHVGGGVIKHIDLWNHNVEFIEQEENWARPAVFVEFCPIRWEAVVPGYRYKSEPQVKLHVVTDWAGSSSADSQFRADALRVLDLSQQIHEALCGMEGEQFMAFDLVETQTNHNHEDIVENIEIYECVAVRKLPEK